MNDPFISRNLFSQHFLRERLPKEDPRWRTDEGQNSDCYRRISELYLRVKPNEKEQYRRNEANLEKDFIRPVLDILGHSYDVQESIHIKYRGSQRPDYTLFPSEETRQAVEGKPQKYRSSVIGLCEAKAWDLELDKTVRIAPDRKANPSLQISNYLRDANVAWGILTNGRKWRLFNKETSLQLDSYYEVDLVDLIEREDAEPFKYFFLLFRVAAFIRHDSAPSFLEDILTGSVRYARELEEDVKENIYEALRLVMKGFLDHPDNGLKSEDLERVHENSLILLYRLLFVLYAEAKELLPTKNSHYRDMSLQRLREDIKEELEKPMRTLTASGDSFWSRLTNLFRLVNNGSVARNIPKEKLFIPPYNGGLFDPAKHPFLETNRVGDEYLAEAVHRLSWSGGRGGVGGFVDYNTLSIRHLGSIYEGLLEFRPAIAKEALQLVKSKGREIYKSAPDTGATSGNINVIGSVPKGEVYLKTDRGERKVTGSYYTPDYVVKYIVERTLGRMVSKLKEENIQGSDLVQRILSMKVLDPAMGSGHFLVEATSYLASQVVEAMQEMEEQDAPTEDTDILWARREVVRHCIYGVDLNPLAVELAKVSLWLHTVTKKKPLSFLDHRLKCGNSIVGVTLSSLKFYPGTEEEVRKHNVASAPAFISKIFIEKLISKIDELERLHDDSLSDVKKKESILVEFRSLPEYEKTKAIADVHCSVYLGNDVASTQKRTAKDVYFDLIYSLDYPSNWEPKTKSQWFKQAISLAEQHRFFHWELEFPEIFFEGGQSRDNPGFDVILGNPPYVRPENQEKLERRFLMDSKKYKTIYGRFDLFAVFLELSLSLCRRSGRFSMIVPAAVLSIDYATKLRKMMLGSTTIESIADLRGVDVFGGVGVECCIPTILNQDPEADHQIEYEIQSSQDARTMSFVHRTPQIPFQSFPNYIMKVELNPELFSLRERIERLSIPLGSICYCITGVVAHDSETGESKDRLIHEMSVDNTCKPYIEAKEWEGRYSAIRPKRCIEYKPELMHRPKFPELFESEKILIQGISAGPLIPATYDTTGVYCNHSLNCCVKLEDVIHHGTKLHLDDPSVVPDKRYSLKYVLAMLNSRLLGFYHHSFVSNDLGIFPETVRNLPLPKVTFSEPEAKRKSNLKKANGLYESLDYATWCQFIDGLMAARSPEGISASTHDVLVFLTDEMLGLHVEKQREIDSLLGWIESPAGLGVKIGDLRNKTKLYRFYDHLRLGEEVARTELETVLAGSSISLNSEKLGRLRDEYDRSARALRDILERIRQTDLWVDGVVYRLYDLAAKDVSNIENLTEEEVVKKYPWLR